MKQHVFIGGPLDGSHLGVEQERETVSYVPSIPVPLRPVEDTLPGFIDNTVTYRRRRIVGHGFSFDYFLLEGLTENFAIVALLDGYQRG